MLLRQVAYEMPFLARHGLIMDKWASVAQALAADENFSRPDFDAKKANNRFAALLDAHKKRNKEAEQASGVSEEVTEKVTLLDDLLAAFEDAKEEEAARAAETKKAMEANEQLGLVVRDEAMQSLGKRKRGVNEDDATTTSGGGKIMKVISMLHEQSVSELTFQREKFNREMEEREKDRQVLTEQMRQQHESTLKQQEAMLKIMNAMVNKLQ
ncbi:hypothetical protein DYB32_010890 [Aphanomyces invadans]|nr:hypothetical protein DYB32_010890 [Aphanomyces invadans]